MVTRTCTTRLKKNSGGREKEQVPGFQPISGIRNQSLTSSFIGSSSHQRSPNYTRSLFRHQVQTEDRRRIELRHELQQNLRVSLRQSLTSAPATNPTTWKETSEQKSFFSAISPSSSRRNACFPQASLQIAHVLNCLIRPFFALLPIDARANVPTSSCSSCT